MNPILVNALTQFVTVLLQMVLPVVISVVVAWVGKEWAQLKNNQKYGLAIDILEQLAYKAISAATQVGDENGWDNVKKHDYVLNVLEQAAASLPIKFTNEQLDAILDAILEGSYLDTKKYDQLETLPIK